jgi:hypothetical protein
MPEETTEEHEELTEPFNVQTVQMTCPFGDEVKFNVELGFVNHQYPMFHLNAPEAIEHFREAHGGS